MSARQVEAGLRERPTVWLIEARARAKTQLALDTSKLMTPHGQGLGWLRDRIRRHERFIAEAQAEIEARSSMIVSFNHDPLVESAA